MCLEREEVRMEGVLSRKHEWESVDRKSSNRSWDKVYCVINASNRLEFFKDQKHFKNVRFVIRCTLFRKLHSHPNKKIKFVKKTHNLQELNSKPIDTIYFQNLKNSLQFQF